MYEWYRHFKLSHALKELHRATVEAIFVWLKKYKTEIEIEVEIETLYNIHKESERRDNVLKGYRILYKDERC